MSGAISQTHAIKNAQDIAAALIWGMLALTVAGFAVVAWVLA